MGDDGQRQPTGDGLEVRVPLTEFVKRIAREAGSAAAKEVLAEHKRDCPINVVDARSQTNSDKIGDEKVAAARRWGILVGLAVAANVIGGIATAVITARLTAGN